jgi:SNF2 family DNA or RNA helicase
VFSQSVRMLDILQRCLQGVDMTFERIDGASSDTDRQRIIDSFNKDSTISVCLLSTKVLIYALCMLSSNVYCI